MASMILEMRQERRHALRRFYDRREPVRCYVLLCAQAHNNPVFVIENLDGSCESVPVGHITFVREDWTPWTE